MVFIGMFGGEEKTGLENRLNRKWKEKHIFQNQRAMFSFLFSFYIFYFKFKNFTLLFIESRRKACVVTKPPQT